MAGDSSRSSFSEVVLAVQEQIEKFAVENQIESDRTVDPHLEKVAENCLRKTWRRQIRSLEREVSSLEKRICLKKQIQTRRRNMTDDKPNDIEKLRRDIQSLENKLEINQSLTNIEVLKTNCHIVRRGIGGVSKNQFVEGQCQDVIFKLDLTITESLEDESLTQRVTELNVHVEVDTYRDLSSHIDEIVNNCCVHGFFRLIEPYSNCKQQRKQTFAYFSSTFPSLVSVDESDLGSFLLIQSKKSIGATYCIRWSFCVSKTYRVLPDLELSMRAPAVMVNMDRSKHIQQAPQVFKEILKLLGIEKAILSVIKLVD